MSMSKAEREALISQYVEDLIEGCDLDVLFQLAYEHLFEIKEQMEDEELLTDIEENSPYLLEDLDVVYEDGDEDS